MFDTASGPGRTGPEIWNQLTSQLFLYWYTSPPCVVLFGLVNKIRFSNKKILRTAFFLPLITLNSFCLKKNFKGLILKNFVSKKIMVLAKKVFKGNILGNFFEKVTVSHFWVMCVTKWWRHPWRAVWVAVPSVLTGLSYQFSNPWLIKPGFKITQWWNFMNNH